MRIAQQFRQQQHEPTNYPLELADELRRIRLAIERLDQHFDEFAGVFLNAKFPYGKPTDRWARR
jgi:hypothetical protein